MVIYYPYTIALYPALVSRLITRGQGERMLMRQLTKVDRGLRERRFVPELASQWDGRIDLKSKKKRICPNPDRAGVHHTFCYCTIILQVAGQPRHPEEINKIETR